MSHSRSDSTHYNTVLIGAGPSGLATSYALKQRGISYVTLEGSDQVASSWKYVWEDFELAQRVDEISMAGLDLSKQFDANYRLKRDEIIRVFKQYADEHELNIKFNTRVSIIKNEMNHSFVVECDNGNYTADNIVICVGARQQPKYPDCISKELVSNYTSKILHSSWYQGVKSLPENGNILIVGGGLSALSICHDLISHNNFSVHLACGYDDAEIIKNNKHLPTVPVTLHELESKGVSNLGKLVKSKDESSELCFSKCSYSVNIDAYDKLIFATGYTSSYDVIFKMLGQNSDVLDAVRDHHHGITTVPGLYVVGIPSAGEKTVTINQGNEHAMNVVDHIIQKSSTINIMKTLSMTGAASHTDAVKSMPISQFANLCDDKSSQLPTQPQRRSTSFEY